MHKRHIVKEVKPGSIAEEMEIAVGDEIVSINDTELEDIFDYDFLCMDEEISVLVRKPSGEEWELDIEKEEHEDLGLVFESALMDDCRSCKNHCIFCFIDQNPRGMRKMFYFKDDDTRMSFLHGNYVTLTNWSDREIDRIIHYRMEPINISVQTMDPELRCKMLRNPEAGKALKYLDRLYEAGIKMNGQIVLCKGVNDGDALRYTLDKMLTYAPVMQSASIVPVGITKFRDKLYPLEPFEKDDAAEVIDIIEAVQKKAMDLYGIHFCHASDEWYITAERPLPEEERYDGYLQLENGVGMARLLINESREAIEELAKRPEVIDIKRHVTIACGKSITGILKSFSAEIKEKFPGVEADVVMIRNDFFGEKITVSGLLTGGDIMAQLKDHDIGDALLLGDDMLKSGDGFRFLDDTTVEQVSETLHCPVLIVKSGGRDIVFKTLGVSE